MTSGGASDGTWRPLRRELSGRPGVQHGSDARNAVANSAGGGGGSGRLDGAASIEPRQELGPEDLVGLVDRAGPGQRQFLDQPILGGGVEPFDASLGLGAVGEDQLDAQFVEGPAKLRLDRLGIVAAVLAPEDAVAVGVEGDRPAVLSQISAEQVEVAIGGLSFSAARVGPKPP